MTVQRDFELAIEAFLEDGPRVLPNRSYDAVRTAIEETRQRVVLGPWREDQMNKIVAFGIAAAAVVLVAVIGIQLLPPSGGVGGQAVPTPTSNAPTDPPTQQPTAAVAPTPDASASSPSSPIPLPGQATVLEPGRYLLSDAASTRLPFSFEVPEGWWTQDSVVVKHGQPGDLTTPDLLFYPTTIMYVNRDACHRRTGDWFAVTSADDIAEAMGGQTGYFKLGASGRHDVGELMGRFFVIGAGRDDTYPGVDAADCDGGVLRSWNDPSNIGDGGAPIFDEQVVTLYVLDVDGTPLSLVAVRQGSSSASDVSELESIVDSVRVVSTP